MQICKLLERIEEIVNIILKMGENELKTASFGAK